MLNTNDISNIAHSIGTAIGGMVTEIVSGLIAVLASALVAYWRKSRTQKAVIGALVRGVEKSSDSIGDGETAFIKKTIQNEAAKSGVEQHVDKAVQEVTAKMEQEKTDAKINGDGI